MAINGEVPTFKRQRDDLSEASDDSGSVLFLCEATLKTKQKRFKVVQHAVNPTTELGNEAHSISTARKICPYNPDQPRLPFFHPLRLTLEKLVTDVLSPIISLSEEQTKPGYNDSELKGVISKMRKYAIPASNYEAPKPIAFIGRAGVGKSLTLSCVLDRPGIALDSKDPVRGTNLPHEYSAFEVSRDKNAERSKYRASAVYFTDEEIKAKVMQICVDAFKFLDSCEEHDCDAAEEHSDLDKLDVDNETPKTSSTNSSTEELGQRYNSAIQYLLSLIGNEIRFQTGDEIDTFFRAKQALRLSKSKDDDEILLQTTNTLAALILEFLQIRIESKDANDLHELQQVYRDMTKPELSSQAHPWRAMEKLVVSFDHELLQAGAILGDTPGLSDLDQSVVDGMNRYARSAGALILCTTFARSDADSVLEEALALAVRLQMHRSIFLVLTMIDESRPERTEEEKMSLTHSPEDAAAIETAELERGVLHEHHRALTNEKQQLNSEKVVCQARMTELTVNPAFPADAALLAEFMTNMSRIKELDASIDLAQVKLEYMPARIAEAQGRIKELRNDACNKADQAAIQAKNRDLEATYKGKIRAYTRNSRDPDLPVVFVSGKQYKKHLEGYQGGEGPFLDVEATGIPSLKRLVNGLATATHFFTLKEIALEHTPRLIKSAITVLSKKPLPEMEKVRSSIHLQIEEGTTQIIHFLCRGIWNAFATHIKAVFENKGNTQAWLAKAERLAANLPGNYHFLVFRSFCSKGGIWHSQKKPYRWNRSIIDIYRKLVEPACDAFQADCDDVKSDTLEYLTEFFDQLRESIAGGPYKGAEGYEDFLDVIQATQNALLEKVGPFLDAQLDTVATIRADLLLDPDEGSPQSYVGQAMRNGYAKAASMTASDFTTVSKGKRPRTAHDARVATIRERILGATPSASNVGISDVFESVKTLASLDLVGKRRIVMKRFRSLLKSGLSNRLMQDFDHRHGVSPMYTNGGSKARANMLTALQNGLKKIEDAKQLVIECEKWKRPMGEIL